MLVEPEPILHEIDLSHLVPCLNPPNKFPVGHRLSHAVHRHKLGRIPADSSLLRTTYFVFVLDTQFGVCRLTSITPLQIHRNVRTGKAHFDFRSNYPKSHVVITAYPNVINEVERESVFDSIHRTLITTTSPSLASWL